MTMATMRLKTHAAQQARFNAVCSAISWNTLGPSTYHDGKGWRVDCQAVGRMQENNAKSLTHRATATSPVRGGALAVLPPYVLCS